MLDLGHRMYFIVMKIILFIYIIEILSGTNQVAAIVHITEYQTITKNNAVEWAMTTSEWTIANKRENGLCGTGLGTLQIQFFAVAMPLPLQTHTHTFIATFGWPLHHCMFL